MMDFRIQSTDSWANVLLKSCRTLTNIMYGRYQWTFSLPWYSRSTSHGRQRKVGIAWVPPKTARADCWKNRCACKESTCNGPSFQSREHEPHATHVELELTSILAQSSSSMQVLFVLCWLAVEYDHSMSHNRKNADIIDKIPRLVMWHKRSFNETFKHKLIPSQHIQNESWVSLGQWMKSDLMKLSNKHNTKWLMDHQMPETLSNPSFPKSGDTVFILFDDIH